MLGLAWSQKRRPPPRAKPGWHDDGHRGYRYTTQRFFAPARPCASSDSGATLAFAPHLLRIVTAAATSPAVTSRSALSAYLDLWDALRNVSICMPDQCQKLCNMQSEHMQERARRHE